MCFFRSGISRDYSSNATSASSEEKKDTAKAKQRLLATEGKANGEELNAAQGKSVRKVFG
nr:MAG TPA: hypothetical protein [Caudoviricetes sp.]